VQCGGRGVTVPCAGHVANRGGVEAEHVEDLRPQVVVIYRLGGGRSLQMHRLGGGVIAGCQGKLAARGQGDRQAPSVAGATEGFGRVVEPLAGFTSATVRQGPTQPEQRVRTQPGIAQGGRRLEGVCQQWLGFGGLPDDNHRHALGPKQERGGVGGEACR